MAKKKKTKLERFRKLWNSKDKRPDKSPEKTAKRIAAKMQEMRDKWDEIPLTMPPASDTTRELTEPEAYAVLIHPMYTGVGQFPREDSDADYIDDCLELVKQHGRKAFAAALIRLLKMTERMSWTKAEEREGPPPAPIEPRSKRKLPMPQVDMPPAASSILHPEDMSDQHGVAVLLNPATAGVGPFQPYVSPIVWAYNFSRLMQARGNAQTLVDFLYVVRHTYGTAGVAPGHMPAGYVPVRVQHISSMDDLKKFLGLPPDEGDDKEEDDDEAAE